MVVVLRHGEQLRLWHVVEAVAREILIALQLPRAAHLPHLGDVARAVAGGDHEGHQPHLLHSRRQGGGSLTQCAGLRHGGKVERQKTVIPGGRQGGERAHLTRLRQSEAQRSQGVVVIETSRIAIIDIAEGAAGRVARLELDIALRRIAQLEPTFKPFALLLLGIAARARPEVVVEPYSIPAAGRKAQHRVGQHRRDALFGHHGIRCGSLFMVQREIDHLFGGLGKLQFNRGAACCAQLELGPAGADAAVTSYLDLRRGGSGNG